MAKLHGVDISGYDVPIRVDELTADFVIVKVTEGLQGDRYNPWWRDMLAEGRSDQKLLGCYHYANGEDPVAEADSFYSYIRDYAGEVLPCLDWEGQGNRQFMSGNDVWWCEAFMDRIAELTGSTPMLYTSKGICRLYDWSGVAAKYPLWGAEYAYEDYVYQGYETNPWQSSQSWGAWGEYPDIHQYGYTNPQPNNGGQSCLDGDIFYGTREDWQRMCGGRDSSGEERSMSYRDMVVEAVRSMRGQKYYSMNYGAAEGFNGWMGTNYVGQGFGCAQLGAFGYNTTIGTSYAGSVWNFAGDCLGDPDTNQGGGEFEFTDDPKPGDVVVYLSKGHDGTDAEDYGHLAVYVGDGMVVGSWGVGIPGTSGYWAGRGVSEDPVEDQSLGNGWRYCRSIRLDRMDAEQPPSITPDEVPDEGYGAVYRLYDRASGNHLLTASLDEARGVAGSGWTYEGVAFRVTGTGTEINRLYDPASGDHIYTADEREIAAARTWMSHEGVAFVTEGDVPVYRLYDPASKLHFYTADKAERDAARGWMQDEGVAFTTGRSDVLRYRAHVQRKGWLGWKTDGKTAGTTGKALRMEALQLSLPKGMVVDVLGHVQGVGDVWQHAVEGDVTIGTVGESRRLEGIRIDVRSGPAIQYRAHVQKKGWTDWVDAGGYCGTKGRGLRMEAVQIRLA